MNNLWVDLPQAIKSRITGKLLGDGGITKQINRQPRMQFIHADKDKEWMTYCYHSLKDYIPLQLPTYRKVQDSRLKKGYSESWQCQSRISELITFLEMEWYKDRKKTIPFHLIETCFTNEMLAWWYYDDGHLKKSRSNIPQKIIISTECFSYVENTKLMKLFDKEFQLRFLLDNYNRLVLYDQPSIHYFLHLIQIPPVPCMERKHISYSESLPGLPDKRTTISLPINITLNKPTQEINDSLVNLSSVIKDVRNHMFYQLHYFSLLNTNKRGSYNKYQVVVRNENLEKLYWLKRRTGFSYNSLVQYCFILQK